MSNGLTIAVHVVRYGQSGPAGLVGVFRFQLLPRAGEYISIVDEGEQSITLKVKSVHHDALPSGVPVQEQEGAITLLCEDEDRSAQD